MLTVDSFQEWRTVARDLLQRGVRPQETHWQSSQDLQPALFTPEQTPPQIVHGPIRIPRSFLDLAETVSHHSDPGRWALLYRVAWRLTHGKEPHLLLLDIDDDMAALRHMRKTVAKDVHQMRAFVRFRKVTGPEEHYVAWYEPEHHTLDLNSSFFVNRFGSMRWAILTPSATMSWDLEKLEFGPGVPRTTAPQQDELENVWRAYYQTIFNPARLKLNAMCAQLPIRAWKNLPEAQAIPEMVRQANGRVQLMAEAQPPSAQDLIPPNASLSELRTAVRKCNACDVCSRATQPVFGAGNPQASIMLVGEQPGDEEDLAGRPFIGPAGQVLDAALQPAGLHRPDLYLTNAVKAFKFEERGKRRIHQSPRNYELSACRPWLMAEMEAVRPSVIVCLGASAAQSVLGRKVQIGAERPNVVQRGDAKIIVTYHPSAILRTPDANTQEQFRFNLITDLTTAAQLVAKTA
jgi:probable DNA metabolism protein